MAYSPALEKELAARKIAAGDRVRVFSVGREFEGILMPRPDAGDKDALVLKLDSGYNAGVKFDSSSKIEKLASRQAESIGKAQRAKIGGQDKSLPMLSLVSTGGTIASRVDYKTGGVKAVMDPEEIFSNSPELARAANFKSIVSPFTTFSENMAPREWQKIAETVVKELNSEVDGVIVTHGTDTLHFTAAALSFMLRDLGKPVALVGAQRSPDRGSFDGSMNLLCASHWAGKGSQAEVAIVMHGTSSDDYCIASRGTKVRKMHTSRRDAFRPINDSPLAKIWRDGKIERTGDVFKQRDDSKKTVADTKFEEKISLVKTVPGSDPSMVDWLLEKGARGIVVEATGLGQVPIETSDPSKNWLSHLKKAIDSGVVVAVASQCIYGRTNPNVYEAGRRLLDAGAVFCGDMLPETAYVKLGFVLGHEKKPEKARELMLQNLAGELNSRLAEDLETGLV